MQPGSANGPAASVAASLQMAPADASASASEWDNDSGRPAFLNVFLPTSVPVPATAVRATTPERERRTTRPAFINVFMPPAPPLPEMTMADLQRRLQDPSVEIITHPPPRNQFRFRADYLAHVALLDYPKEQRHEEGIHRSCGGFGFVVETDPACFAAPDLSPVHLVVKLVHPRSIPREVRIRYGDLRFRNVVPVQIMRVWDKSLSTGADGEYVPMFEAAAAAS
ncbi:hypothetical protein CFC21_096810 [Triticum aestivum]|uniref:Uncharacterized protein n=3 Tax=Triticum TaxID=4564 RepID=A0A9R1LT60_WHEAT|nr:hypothetical protein CFC21_096806 [Triticum aestivum]KAF7094504.1 hypothetical protein CFC21_096807 [Triticum aestivum]KAF7094507.1 hypothetical protein CFC21_096810 [Triticum aestivum]